MSFRKLLFPLLLLLPVPCMAQEATFQSFLQDFRECSRVELSCYGDVKAANNPYVDKEIYKNFLPVVADSIMWLKGSCFRHGDIIVAMLRKWDMNVYDKYKHYIMENDVCNFMLITYSAKGELIDSKVLGKYGGNDVGNTYYTNITPTDDPLKFRAEQATLDGDGSMLVQYREDLVYTVVTHEYTIGKDGKITDKVTGTKKEHRRPKGTENSGNTSFAQFKSYFAECTAPYNNDSLFEMKVPGEFLSVPDCFNTIPDTILSNVAPRDAELSPCRYIETEENCFFFMVEGCMIPIEGYPYTDYKILEFDKKGRFKKQYIVAHFSDDMDIDYKKIPGVLSQNLKEYEHLWKTPN